MFDGCIIGISLPIDSEVKKRWHQLREAHVRRLKMRISCTGDGTKVIPKGPYEEMMCFLNAAVKHRK